MSNRRSRIRRTPSAGSHIEFLEYRQPRLLSGVYDVEVAQTLQSGKSGTQSFSKTARFVVTGERFGPLSPHDIVDLFPPRESVGEHSNVLPHIALRRPTLPWERRPGSGDHNYAWLALLLFRESDFADAEPPRRTSMELRELLKPASDVRFPTLTLEPSQDESDLVEVIDVQRKLLEIVLPTFAELSILSHAHQRKASDGTPEGDAEAIVFCHRLPEPGGESIVHLVSLERRYPDGQFDFQNAGDNDWIRLVSLANWSFDSIDPARGFKALLHGLDRSPSVVRMARPSGMGDASPAARYVDDGYMPFPHQMRHTDKTVSFYRGPLLPGAAQANPVALPALSADELLRYDAATGIFDVSYAAAFEAGRLLTLANTHVALALYNWKREQIQAEEALGVRNFRRMPFRRQAHEEGMPPVVREWLDDLALLAGVPFNYIIPDERLLPAEGLRFFHLDAAWVACLLDGAASLGRLTEADREHERGLLGRHALQSGPGTITGFVMRSEVVSGWPKLLIEAYPERITDPGFLPSDGHPLPQLRLERLAADVLIGLFAGEVQTIDVFQAPEGMHFGVDAPNGNPPELTKNLRDRSGVGHEDVVIRPLPWHDQAKGTIDMMALADEIEAKLPSSRSRRSGDFTAAQLAMQMIEGMQKIRFIAQP